MKPTEDRLKKVTQTWTRGILSEKDEHELLKTLTTLSVSVGNVLDHLGEDKFCRIPAANKRFVSTVVEAKGGLEFIVAMGWVKSTLEGKEFWTLDSSDPAKLEALKSARKLIDERKDLVSLKIEGAAKALEQEKKKKKKKKKKKVLCVDTTASKRTLAIL
eukprot:TRINITY_DN6006_c0_g1_i5.p1 TRINITY_DN6006_c0_g1~~TRINITY_DN6006_c0_g1_i5.p1  ORF type:complete len:160 (+),score=48.07 TRINITY_DN6006_c0_g1_i5:244-723(+)